MSTSRTPAQANLARIHISEISDLGSRISDLLVMASNMWVANIPEPVKDTCTLLQSGERLR